MPWNSAAEAPQRAAECAALAEGASRSETRKIYETLRDNWLQLANDLRRAEGLAENLEGARTSMRRRAAATTINL